MASTASTRRVLGDMSVNTPVGSTPKKNFRTGLDMDGHGKTDGKLFAEIENKRFNDMGSEENAAKRRRIDTDTGRGSGFLSPRREFDLTSPRSSVSPSSSFGNNTTEMNDSQNTILTIPDEGPRYNSFTSIPPVVQTAPLTAAQLRAKATSIRLRLTLASYKLRTNQIDVPISRLEIRSSQTPHLPQLRRSTSTSTTTSLQRGRTALPSASTSNPQLQNLTHSREQQGQDIPSSPPPSRSANRDNQGQPPVSPAKGIEHEVVAFATPILPRHRAGLLNPPLLGGREEDGERDLTSSVVKGRAADGLLRLMGVRE